MSECLSRRRFLCRLTVIGAAALLGPAAADAGKTAAWVRVGPASKFVRGRFGRVNLPDGGGAYVTRKSDGTYLALSDACTHRGCPVEWDPRSRHFVCPCHQGRYDDSGANVGGPPPRPLPVCRTRVEADGALSLLPPE